MSTLRQAALICGASDGRFLRWIAAIAGLHDIGKCIPGFQAKWPEGRAADESLGLVFTPFACKQTDHAQCSAYFVCQHLQQLGASKRWAVTVAQALGAHHGFHSERRKPLVEHPGWQETRQALFEAYWLTLRSDMPDTQEPLSLPAVEWLAGLVSVADWIASNQDWFPLG